MSRATAVTSRGGAGGRLEVQRVALLELAGCCDGYPAAVALLGSASRRDGDPAAAALLGSAGRCDGDSAVAALLVSAGRRDGDSAAAARLLAFLSQFGDPAVPQMSDKSQYFMVRAPLSVSRSGVFARGFSGSVAFGSGFDPPRFVRGAG